MDDDGPAARTTPPAVAAVRIREWLKTAALPDTAEVEDDKRRLAGVAQARNDEG